MNVASRPRLDDESGVSLVELLVAALVGAVMLAVVATVFVTTLQANAATRDRDLATGRLQAISASLSTGLRNASADAVTVETIAGGGLVARAAIADGSSGWVCRAWAVVDLVGRDGAGATTTGADGRFELRHTQYAPLAGSTVAPAPTTSWGVLADHVGPIRNGASSLPYFVWSRPQLTWNLAATSAEQPQLEPGGTAALSGSAVARGFENGRNLRCS